MKFHIAVWGLQRRKAEFGIQIVGVAGQQNPAAQILECRMLDDALHKPFAEAETAMGLEQENIAEIGDGSVVGDYAGKADLTAVFVIHTKT